MKTNVIWKCSSLAKRREALAVHKIIWSSAECNPSSEKCLTVCCCVQAICGLKLLHLFQFLKFTPFVLTSVMMPSALCILSHSSLFTEVVNFCVRRTGPPLRQSTVSTSPTLASCRVYVFIWFVDIRRMWHRTTEAPRRCPWLPNFLFRRIWAKKCWSVSNQSFPRKSHILSRRNLLSERTCVKTAWCTSCICRQFDDVSVPPSGLQGRFGAGAWAPRCCGRRRTWRKLLRLRFGTAAFSALQHTTCRQKDQQCCLVWQLNASGHEFSQMYGL